MFLNELPGRLNEMTLYHVEIQHWRTITLATFALNIDNEFVHVMYDVNTKLWHVDLDKVRCENIPYDFDNETVSDYQAKQVLRKVLTRRWGKPAFVKAVKRWRDILQVFPAKLLTLKNS